MFIYLITNNINGKYYIGQTASSVGHRWSQHIHSAKGLWDKGINYFYNAIRKYGKENFKIETLCECPDRNSLNESEIFLIKMFGSRKPSIGYNTDDGGESSSPSEATRKRISESSKGKKKSLKARENMRKARLGTKRGPHSQETIDKIRKSNTGKKRSAESISKQSKSRKGICITKETRAKLSEAGKKAWINRRAKESGLNRKLTPEHKAKISASLKKTLEEKRKTPGNSGG